MLYNLETKFIAFCKPFLQIDILFTLQLRFVRKKVFMYIEDIVSEWGLVCQRIALNVYHRSPVKDSIFRYFEAPEIPYFAILNKDSFVDYLFRSSITVYLRGPMIDSLFTHDDNVPLRDSILPGIIRTHI